MGHIFIIAEAGDNHNGSFDHAVRLIETAAEAGADCVKFQTFLTEEVISRYAEMAEYQKKNTGKEETQFAMVKRLELSFDQFRQLKTCCEKCGILFLSSPFDLPSIAFLDEIGVPVFKIPSGEITNYPYLVAVANTHKDILLSTGMCTMDEIGKAIAVLEDNGAGTITLLHCNTEYPTPFEDVNLRAMETMRLAFGKEVGYSDHTTGIEVPIAAAALGAVVIEKHFTLDKTMEGPDHAASLEPQELTAMVKAIRKIETALGSAEKEPSPSEQKNIPVARKSLVARRAIRRGELFTAENLAVKRPGTGLSPMHYPKLLGTKAVRDFGEDELIEAEEGIL